MSSNNIELNNTAPDPDVEPLPTFRDWAQAQRVVSHRIYQLVMAIWPLVLSFHHAARTRREAWEPPDLAITMLSQYFNKDAAERVERECAERLDPQIQQIEDDGVEIDQTVQKVITSDRRVVSPETGLSYSEADAVARVHGNQEKITTDVEHGCTHHRRVHPMLRFGGKVTPYFESVGLMAMLSFWLNVEWTHPLLDPLSWTLSVVIVLATLIITPRCVERAGEGWNQRRQAISDHQRTPASLALRKLVVNGSLAVAVCSVVTGLLIERALAVTDQMLPTGMLWLIVALCIVAGFALPGLAFLAKAFDGSSYSREDDGLVRQLDAGLEEDLELRAFVQSRAASCEMLQLHINTETAPAIFRIGEEVAEEARQAYVFLRFQIGLPEAPPSRPDSENPETVSVRRCIPLGIPGAEPIRLEPLVDRGLRLRSLDQHRAQVLSRLEACAAHPWGSTTASATTWNVRPGSMSAEH